jgi:hypothetical protein
MRQQEEKRLALAYEKENSMRQQEEKNRLLALAYEKNSLKLADKTLITDLTKRNTQHLLQNLELKQELDQAKLKAARVLSGLVPRYQANALLSEIFGDTIMDEDDSSMMIPDSLYTNQAMRHHQYQQLMQLLSSSSSSNNSHLSQQELLPAFSSVPPVSDLERYLAAHAAYAGSSSRFNPDGTLRRPQHGKGNQGGRW